MKTAPITFMFPGQGSQFAGMGRGLFQRYPQETSVADRVLGYSVEQLCLEDAEHRLGQTQFTQPALFVVNALSFLDAFEQDQQRPSSFVGHSLGEYNALLAAQVFDFETGLRLVQKRGELMSHAKNGGMAAVLGLSTGRIREALREADLGEVDLANLNAPDQTVISGSASDIALARPALERSGARLVVPLKVSGAFHSRFMRPAQAEFRAFLNGFEFNEPSLPVISNAEAIAYCKATARDLLAAQLVSPVRWCESVQALLQQGCEHFREIGPGRVLTGLLQKIKNNLLPAAAVPPSSPPPTQVRPAQTAPDTHVGSPARNGARRIRSTSLGSAAFRRAYGLTHAYTAGAMYKGIASKELVVALGKARLLGFLGTGGMSTTEIEDAVRFIQGELRNGEPYGMNLLCNLDQPRVEEETVDLFLKHAITRAEASAYIQITPALARYRLKGLARGAGGKVECRHKVIAKVSRPEVAEAFLSPAPPRLTQKLLESGEISQTQFELAAIVPMADDLCVEADSAGHTDQGVAYALMPAMITLRDEMMRKHAYGESVRVGAAGGIGTPAAAAAAFIMGADFITTGSINQCTVESGASVPVKEMLQTMNVQDTAYAPAGDMFELGARVQVLRKGLFFPARANKLYELYKRHDSIEEIDPATRKQIEEKYFRRSFDEVWRETSAYYQKNRPEEFERASRNPKQKMALIFRWYFVHSTRLAMEGSAEQKVDYQVHCGPALGAFNQWVKGTILENWRERKVTVIALKLMEETATLLSSRFEAFTQSSGE